MALGALAVAVAAADVLDATTIQSIGAPLSLVAAKAFITATGMPWCWSIWRWRMASPPASTAVNATCWSWTTCARRRGWSWCAPPPAARATGRRLTCAAASLEPCNTNHLRDCALLVRLPARHRVAIPWRHLSLDAPLPGELAGRLEQRLTAKESGPLGERVSGAELSIRIDALLAALPPAQAVAVRLTLLQGLSLREAAAQLGVSRSTVHRAQRQGLVALRERLRA